MDTVEQQPSVMLALWKILRVDAGTQHFVGADTRDYTGRVSTAIVRFDAAAMVGETSSGRVYSLVGAPGDSEQADYVWDTWCVQNGIRAFEDVTEHMLTASRTSKRL
ncbi:hypothetical protein AB4851_08270 [Burkholderia sp. 22PA0099]|uniref:hypothetical protein n=1 Tax=Burkholderia sp. 22PA0099 TaxID=3237372 RepID=UPI0039C30C89